MNVIIFSIRKKKKSDRFASSRMLSNALVGSIVHATIEEPRGGPLSAAKRSRRSRKEMAGESGRKPRIDRRELKGARAFVDGSRTVIISMRFVLPTPRRGKF